MIEATCKDGKCRVLLLGTGADLMCELAHIVGQVIKETEMPDDCIKILFEMSLKMAKE